MKNPRAWRVSGYYADHVEPPKQPGALAIEVELTSRSAAELERDCLQERPDIGDVIFVQPVL